MFRTAWAFVVVGTLLIIGVFMLLFARSRREVPGPLIERLPDPESYIADIQAAIERRNRSCIEALERGDAHAYAENFTEDSLSMPGQAPILRGRSAIESAIAEAFSKVRFVRAETVSLDTRFNGKVAYETGVYHFVVARHGSNVEETLSGRYLVIWKRVGEEWKIAVDAAQPGAPPQ